MRSLLRNVADGLRPDKPEVDPGWEYCHVGHDIGCDTCDAGRNKRRCPLSDDEYLTRWVSWHLLRIDQDPQKWAGDARSQISQSSNPGQFILFRGLYEMAAEQEGMEHWRQRLSEVLAAWMYDGWLAYFAGEARERQRRNGHDQTANDIADEADAVLALAVAAGIEPQEQAQMVNGVNMNPTVGRPTTEWGSPLGRRMDIAQDKGIVKT